MLRLSWPQQPDCGVRTPGESSGGREQFRLGSLGGSEEAQGVNEGLRVLGLMASKWEVLQPWEAGSIPGQPGPPISHPLPLRLHSVHICFPRGPHLSVKQAHPVMFSSLPPLLQSFIHCSVRVM